MKWKEFLRTWEGVKTENLWLRGFIGALIVIILCLMVLVFRKETVVTVQPFTLTEEAWISSDQSSQSYKEAWGMALSQLIGNVTPATVDFLKERLSPILSARIYQDVIDVLEVQATDIKKDRVTMRFEPRVVIYEQSTNKVFVEGRSFVRGAQAAEKASERTYEFVINVVGYMPQLDHIETYSGRANTKEQLKRTEQRNKRSNNEN